MDEESQKLLARTLELAEENNKILHRMRRSQRISSVMSFLYWLFIIGSAVGAYYFIQPYLNQVMSMYNNASAVLRNLKQ